MIATTKNDVTGDSIKSKTGNFDAYTIGWERIFGRRSNKVSLKPKAKRKSMKQDSRKNDYQGTVALFEKMTKWQLRLSNKDGAIQGQFNWQNLRL